MGSDDPIVAYQRGRCEGLLEYRKEIHALRAQLAASRERERALREIIEKIGGGASASLDTHCPVTGKPHDMSKAHETLANWVMDWVARAVALHDEQQALAAAPEPEAEETNDATKD